MKINFFIFKTLEKTGKQPDFKIALVEDPKKRVGGCWKKEGKRGPYLSCELNDEFKKQSATSEEDFFGGRGVEGF